MTGREYLSQTLTLDRRINSMLEQITVLRAQATQATVTLSDMPKSSSPEVQPLEGVVLKIVDLEREVTAKIDALIDLKREIMSAIEKLPSQEDQLLLEQRYLCCKSWPEVAAFLDRDVRHIHKRHTRAVTALENFLCVGVQKTLNATPKV